MSTMLGPFLAQCPKRIIWREAQWISYTFPLTSVDHPSVCGLPGIHKQKEILHVLILIQPPDNTSWDVRTSQFFQLMHSDSGPRTRMPSIPPQRA